MHVLHGLLSTEQQRCVINYVFKIKAELNFMLSRADFMARLVIRNALFFGSGKMSSLLIPWVTYTDPEIAHVGLFEVNNISAPIAPCPVLHSKRNLMTCHSVQHILDHFEGVPYVAQSVCWVSVAEGERKRNLSWHWQASICSMNELQNRGASHFRAELA